MIFDTFAKIAKKYTLCTQSPHYKGEDTGNATGASRYSVRMCGVTIRNWQWQKSHGTELHPLSGSSVTRSPLFGVDTGMSDES